MRLPLVLSTICVVTNKVDTSTLSNLVENERQRRAARCEGPSHLQLTSDVALDSSCQEPIETDKAPNIVSTDDELDDSDHDCDFNLASTWLTAN